MTSVGPSAEAASLARSASNNSRTLGARDPGRSAEVDRERPSLTDDPRRGQDVMHMVDVPGESFRFRLLADDGEAREDGVDALAKGFDRGLHEAAGGDARPVWHRLFAREEDHSGRAPGLIHASDPRTSVLCISSVRMSIRKS
jgi:hypothetical protein